MLRYSYIVNRIIANKITAIKPKCKNNPHLFKAIILVPVLMVSLIGCQSQRINTTSGTVGIINVPITTTTNPDEVSSTKVLFLPSRMPAFNIQGKIGVVTPKTENQPRSSGSAFYVWAQENERFAIDLTGALGIGHTVIEFNGQNAVLTSERSGTITAADPDTLLAQATGWQAPISQLPYWISGSPAPSDSLGIVDEYQRLASAVNRDWTATFSYRTNDETTPSKLKIMRKDGYKVVMTIDHNMPPMPSSMPSMSTQPSDLPINSADTATKP